jgi:hypothetical protein
MTVYEAYVAGELHPFVTRKAIFYYCDIYGAFQELRKQYGYEEAIYRTSDKMCASEGKVKVALRQAKVRIK